MSNFGVQFKDASGNIVIDLGSRLGIYVGTYYVPSLPAQTSQFVSVPGMVPDGSWFILYKVNYTYFPTNVNIETNGFTVQNPGFNSAISQPVNALVFRG